MKRFILSLLIIALMATSIFFVVGCNKEDEEVEENVATGKFTYQLVTADEEIEAYDENGNIILDDQSNPKKFSKYYKVTGFTISNEDEEKMDKGDFSSVKKYQTIEMPKTYKDLDGATENYPVYEIDAGAFSGNRVFRNIKVGKNYGIINEGAFSGVSKVEEIELPFIGKERDAYNNEKLFGFIFGTTAKTDGFTACATKPSILMENGSDISSATEVTYYIPNSLKKVTILTGEIKSCAFANMKTLREIVIPDTVTAISSYAFYNCTALQSFVMPNGVTTVEEYAFNNCQNLFDFTFSEELATINRYAFSNCYKLGSSLVGEVTFSLPNKVASIGDYAFSGLVGVKKLDLSNILATEISVGAFSGLTLLDGVTLKPNSVIKTNAFTGASTLKKENVTNFESATVSVGAFDFDY